jgi:hypothetical protein
VPQNITETPGWDTPLTAPAGGDPRTSAAWLAHLQKFANRLGLLGANGGVAANVSVPVPLSPVDNASARFTADYLTNSWAQNNLAVAAALGFQLVIPTGLKLKEVRAVVRGSAGHGALPANMPGLTVKRSDAALGGTGFALSTEANITDPSASVAAYEVWHEIAATGLNVASNPTTRTIYAAVIGEAGAGSQTGFVLTRLYMVVGL